MMDSNLHVSQVQSIEQYVFIWQAAIDALLQLKAFEEAKVCADTLHFCAHG